MTFDTRRETCFSNVGPGRRGPVCRESRDEFEFGFRSRFRSMFECARNEDEAGTFRRSPGHDSHLFEFGTWTARCFKLSDAGGSNRFVGRPERGRCSLQGWADDLLGLKYVALEIRRKGCA